MEIFFSKLLHILALAFAPLHFMCFWGAIVVGICVWRGRMQKETAKRLGIMALTVTIPYLLLLGASALLLHFSARHRFNALMAQKPTRLVVSSEGKTNEITDASVIADLFRVITRSEKVMAHHSHTVSQVALLFPETGYMYSLRRDSQYPTEYWFGWSGISGRERDWLHVGASLGQLRSDELDRWVMEHAPGGAIPGKR